jgi:hypothetical protein
MPAFRDMGERYYEQTGATCRSENSRHELSPALDIPFFVAAASSTTDAAL